jgi:hypothetical protein
MRLYPQQKSVLDWLAFGVSVGTIMGLAFGLVTGALVAFDIRNNEYVSVSGSIFFLLFIGIFGGFVFGPLIAVGGLLLSFSIGVIVWLIRRGK